MSEQKSKNSLGDLSDKSSESKKEVKVEWKCCTIEPPKDGQHVRVRLLIELDMYYLSTCKLAKWIKIESKEVNETFPHFIEWHKLEGKNNFHNQFEKETE